MATPPRPSSTLMRTLGKLAAAYPHANLKPETLAVYAEQLQDLPERALINAAESLLATRQFFPSIAELRAEATKARSGGCLPSAGEAWEEVLRMASKVGARGTPEFSSPVIHRAVLEAGGWVALCTEDEVWGRKRFLETYPQVAQDQRRINALPAPKDTPALDAVRNAARLRLTEGDDR